MPKLDLTTKMSLLVSLLVAAVLSAMTLAALWYLECQFVSTVSRQQYSMVSIMAEEIDSKLQMTQRQLAAVARMVTPEVLGTPERAERFLLLQPDEMETFDCGMGLTSADGKLLATFPPLPELVGKEISHRDILQRTVSTGKPVISQPFRSRRSHHHPVIAFTAPVFDAKGKLIAVLWGSHDLTRSNYLGKLASSRIGDGGYLCLYNDQRTVVVHPDHSMIMKKDEPRGVDEAGKEAVARFEGTGETVDGSGRALLTSFKRLKTTDWTLAVNYPRSEVYAPLRQARWYLVSALVVALLASLAVSWRFMRYLTAPLVTFIRHVEKMTGQEHEPEPIRIETRDEIGTLARAFNRMVHEAHRQKEAALAQEAFCENLLQHSSVATCVLDAQHRVLIWNKACEELTGVPANRVVGTDRAWQAFYPERRPLLADLVLDGELGALSDLISKLYSTCARSPVSPEGLTAEGWFPDLDGRERFLCFDAAPIRDGNRRVIAAIETLKDITERKQAEESLQKLSLALEQMPVTVMITDREGLVEYVNPNFTTVTGYLPEEMIGRNPNLVKSGLHPTEFFRDLWAALLSGQAWRGEICNKRKNGELYWESASISPVIGPSGEIHHFVGVKQDITERKRAEQELSSKDERIRLLLDSTAEAIYGVDLTGACTFANHSCARLLGYAHPDELLGRNMHRLIHHTRPDGSAYPQEECPLCQTLKGEAGIHVDDDYFWRQDGSFFAAEYWSYPQLSGGVAVGAVVTFFDITERKRAEEELKLASAVAEAATQAKSQFLATMSHEIRTPMNAVLGMLYLLRQTTLSERQKNYLDKAQTASGMLLKLINDILDFSKVEAGKLELESAPFSLKAVLDDLTALAGATILHKPIELRVQVAPEVPDRLIGDPLRLGQVLLNLASNAVKFTEQGEIEIGVALEAAVAGEAALRFSVTDSGIGMTPEQQTALFNAFTQADTSTTRRYGGTGLGLAISKELVELMGGSIWVQSERGVGSTFSFVAHLKIQQKATKGPATGEAQDAGRREPQRLDGARILLVEDNALNQEVAKELLERRGARVDLAANGVEALRLLGSGGAYHAVLMDLSMPEMDGLEATRRIRQNPAFDRLPIIAMTASAMDSERHRCLEAGMNDRVSKPIEVEQMFATLARWVAPRLAEAPAKGGRVEAVAGWAGLPELPGIELSHALRIVESAPLFKRLLVSFGRENAGAAAKLREQLAAGELEAARLLVHSLKGVAGNLGAETLHKAASSLETALIEGEEAAPALESFEEKLAEVLKAGSLLEEGVRRTAGEPGPPVPAPERERLARLARQLVPLLEAHNLGALLLWEEMRPLLAGEDALLLDARLQALDFGEASRVLGVIMQQLEIPHEG